jgi:hypothetical protein
MGEQFLSRQHYLGANACVIFYPTSTTNDENEMNRTLAFTLALFL